jgi:hypothetical protein
MLRLGVRGVKEERFFEQRALDGAEFFAALRMTGEWGSG